MNFQGVRSKKSIPPEMRNVAVLRAVTICSILTIAPPIFLVTDSLGLGFERGTIVIWGNGRTWQSSRMLH
jgi:hypothetical protein